jgi:putative colanic acid biosynthesis acetyltransferase WcaF
MRLDLFSNVNFHRGASRLKEVAWLTIQGIFISSWLPGSGWRVTLLRFFGARIGYGVVIKPGIYVKFPWRLYIGNHCWVGENVWIDNLADVSLADHVCVSQGVYLCTGSHDWNKAHFDLIVAPISVGSHAWLCAMSRIAPGVNIGEGAVLGFGCVATKSLSNWTVNFGIPAVLVKPRKKPQSTEKLNCI